MKINIFPWLTNEWIWESGVGVRSMSPVQETIGIIWCGVGLQPDKLVTHTLQPYGIWSAQPPIGYKNASAMVVGSDKTFALASTRIGTGSFSFVDPIPVKKLGDALSFFPMSRDSEWLQSPFVTMLKGANNDARYNRSLQRAAVELAAMQVFYEFPDREDRSLGVMDACPIIGAAQGHPLGAHSGATGIDLDVSYYTFGKNNTQIGSSPTVIWSGGALNSMFDKARTSRLFSLISKYLPESLIMVNTKIVSALPGLSNLQGDNVQAYNHDKHAHISTGHKVNLEALIDG